jgi:hypothetical protein
MITTVSVLSFLNQNQINMRKFSVVILFSVLFTLGSNAGAYEMVRGYSQECMPSEIEQLFSDGTKIEKFGTFPNGDAVYRVAGICDNDPPRPPADTTKNGNIAYLQRPACEAIIMHSPFVYKVWKVLAYVPREWTMATVKLNAQWQIEVTFARQKGGGASEVVNAHYDFRQESFVFKTPADRTKVMGAGCFFE